MPLTLLITNGVAIGFLAYVLIIILAGRSSNLNASTYVITGFSFLWMMRLFI